MTRKYVNSHRARSPVEKHPPGPLRREKCDDSQRSAEISRLRVVYSAGVLGRRIISAGAILLAMSAVVLISRVAYSTPTPRHSSSNGAQRKNLTTLIEIAVQFNRDYESNNVAAVYDQWDASSRAIISRASYIRRHIECPTPPGPATVEGASPVGQGYWVVRYAISGVQFKDYWHYDGGRWRFSLLRSNPAAVRLYKLPFAAYAAAVGCTSP